MRLLRFFQERFGFTRNELTALIVLSTMFLVGSAIKLWLPRRATLPLHQSFAYAALDSQFIALSRSTRDTATTPRHTAVKKASTVPAPGSINVNSASLEQLQSLPGIGPAIAGRIVAYREAHGPFKAVDGVAEVKGIGPRTLERIRPFISVRPHGQVGTP
jgi:competence protein ComEA